MTHAAQSHSAILGYEFRDAGLLQQAFTHRSYAHEAKHRGVQHNERLEFLGDAVLALVISEHLTRADLHASEGQLSKHKARLVSEGTLAGAARRLELGAHLRLGRGEEVTKGRAKPSLLANAFEAVLAAIYLDGGLEAARAFTVAALRLDGEALDQALTDGDSDTLDYKTQLQEWCQKQYETLPCYTVKQESGPDHAKTFQTQVTIHGTVLGVGVGRTKKESEQQAARFALEQKDAYDRQRREG